jgi:hypothetical protein
LIPINPFSRLVKGRGEKVKFVQASLEYVLLVHRDIFWSIVEAIFKNHGGDKFDFKETTIRIFSPILLSI